jgi:uncharacterized membrane protein YeaQ/YmgE (transglycosylase-associated protein family)
MDLILWMLFGAIAGWIASIIMGYKSQGQCIVAGTIGAVLAGLAMQNLTGKPQDGINYFSLIVSVAGSLLLATLTVFIGMSERDKR